MRIVARILGVIIILVLCTYVGLDRYRMQTNELIYQRVIGLQQMSIYHLQKVVERLEKHQCNDASGLLAGG